MLNSDELTIQNILNHIRSSEVKFKERNFKEAIEERREVRNLLNSKYCDEEVLKKIKKELSCLYSSKFDLINDHKIRLNASEINSMVNFLVQKSEEKYQKGDFKGSIRALRRSEKYLAN